MSPSKISLFYEMHVIKKLCVHPVSLFQVVMQISVACHQRQSLFVTSSVNHLLGLWFTQD